jgi:hypothetical protein
VKGWRAPREPKKSGPHFQPASESVDPSSTFSSHQTVTRDFDAAIRFLWTLDAGRFLNLTFSAKGSDHLLRRRENIRVLGVATGHSGHQWRGLTAFRESANQ